MALSITTPRATHNTDGEILAFNFEFKMWAAAVETELAVVFNEGVTGEEEALELNTDYTLSAPNNDYSDGGTVTLVTGSEYAADGNTITIKSALIRSQTYDLQRGGGLNEETLVTVLDRMVRIIQEAELFGTIEQTALSNYMKTLLTDTTAQEARNTLQIYPVIVCNENQIVCNENHIVYNA